MKTLTFDEIQNLGEATKVFWLENKRLPTQREAKDLQRSIKRRVEDLLVEWANGPQTDDRSLYQAISFLSYAQGLLKDLSDA